MRPGPITLLTQRLGYAQHQLHRMGGLLWQSWRHRQTPDGFSREMKAEAAHGLLLARHEAWRCEAFLPDRAPNDPPAIQPGAA